MPSRIALSSILIEMRTRKRGFLVTGKNKVPQKRARLVCHQSGTSILKRDLYSLTGDRLICVGSVFVNILGNCPEEHVTRFPMRGRGRGAQKCIEV